VHDKMIKDALERAMRNVLETEAAGREAAARRRARRRSRDYGPSHLVGMSVDRIDIVLGIKKPQPETKQQP
jgi:hypothetical protein